MRGTFNRGGRRTWKERLILAALIAAPTSAAVAVPAASAPLQLQSPAAEKCRKDLEALLEDLHRSLQGEPGPGLETLEARYRRIMTVYETSVPEADRLKLKPLVQRVLELAGKIKSLSASVPDPNFGASMRRLLAEAQAGGNAQNLDQFAVALAQLSASAQDPARRDQVFDNLRRIFRGDPQALTQIDSAQSAMRSAGASQPVVRQDANGMPCIGDVCKGLRTQAVPAPGRTGIAGAAAARAADPADDPFQGLTLDQKRSKFAAERRSSLATLNKEALETLVKAGLNPTQFASLPAADARLVELYNADLARAGFNAAPRNADEEKRQFEAILKIHPLLARYLARRGLYQLYIQKALIADAVPQGSHFDAWELALDPGKQSGAVYVAVADEGRIFRGLRISSSDGSTRFEGRGDENTALMILRDPNKHREITSRIVTDEQGALAQSRTAVIDTRTNKKIREEMVNIARGLGVTTEFDDGEPVRITEINLKTQERTVKDLKENRVVTIGADGEVKVGSADGRGPVQHGTLDAGGRIQVRRVVLPDGKVVFFDPATPHLRKVLAADGKTLLDYEADLSRLFGEAQGAGREREAREIGKEIARTLGKNDKDFQYSRPLADWLRDVGSKDSGKYASVRLVINAQGEMTLIYEGADGGKRLERAKFAMASTLLGASDLALVVKSPIFLGADGIVKGVGVGADGNALGLDAEGRPRVAVENRWREYLAKGGLQEWGAWDQHVNAGETDDGQKRAWYNPANYWSAAKDIRHVYLRRFDRGGAGWTKAAEKEDLGQKVETEQAYSSTLGSMGKWAYDAPVLGHAIKGGAWVLDKGEVIGSTIYLSALTDVQDAAAHTNIFGIGYAFGLTTKDSKDTYALEIAGGDFRNPLRKLIVDDKDFLRKLEPKVRAELEGEALAARRKALKRELNDREELERQMAAPVSDAELAQALSGHGAGTEGQQLLSMAETTTGDFNVLGLKVSRKAVLTGVGYTTRIVENVGQMACNPVIWATLGVGEGVGALEAIQEGVTTAPRWLQVASKAFGGTGGLLRTAKVTHTLLTGTLYGSWALGGSENAVRLVEAIGKGDSAQAWSRGADVTTDLLFLGLMARDARNARLRESARGELNARQASLTDEARRAGAAVEQASAPQPALRALEAPASLAPEAPRIGAGLEAQRAPAPEPRLEPKVERTSARQAGPGPEAAPEDSARVSDAAPAAGAAEAAADGTDAKTRKEAAARSGAEPRDASRWWDNEDEIDRLERQLSKRDRAREREKRNVREFNRENIDRRAADLREKAKAFRAESLEEHAADPSAEDTKTASPKDALGTGDGSEARGKASIDDKGWKLDDEAARRRARRARSDRAEADDADREGREDARDERELRRRAALSEEDAREESKPAREAEDVRPEKAGDDADFRARPEKDDLRADEDRVPKARPERSPVRPILNPEINHHYPGGIGPISQSRPPDQDQPGPGGPGPSVAPEENPATPPAVDDGNPDETTTQPPQDGRQARPPRVASRPRTHAVDGSAFPPAGGSDGGGGGGPDKGDKSPGNPGAPGGGSGSGDGGGAGSGGGGDGGGGGAGRGVADGGSPFGSNPSGPMSAAGPAGGPGAPPGLPDNDYPLKRPLKDFNGGSGIGGSSAGVANRPAADSPAVYPPFTMNYLGAQSSGAMPELWGFNPGVPSRAPTESVPKTHPRRYRSPSRAPAPEGGAPAAAQPAADDDDDGSAILPPAQHLAGGTLLPMRRSNSDARDMMDLILQFAMAGTLIYLFNFSDFPYLIGLRKRRLKPVA